MSYKVLRVPRVTPDAAGTEVILDFPLGIRIFSSDMNRAETNEKKFDIYIGGTPGPETKETQTPFSNDDTALCVPDPTQSLGDTHVVRLELIQTDGGGQGEGAQEPVAEGVELGHTLGTEVIDDGGPVRALEVGTEWLGRRRVSLLESNVGVSDQEGAEDGVHDRVEGAGGEGSDREGDQTDAYGTGTC